MLDYKIRQFRNNGGARQDEWHQAHSGNASKHKRGPGDS